MHALIINDHRLAAIDAERLDTSSGLALFTADGPKVGFGLWNLHVTSYLVETWSFLIAAMIWNFTKVKHGKALSVFAMMVIVQTVFFFSEPVPMPDWAISAAPIAFLSLFAVGVWWAFDRQPSVLVDP